MIYFHIFNHIPAVSNGSLGGHLSFVDAEGVVHFTNAQYDERYQLYCGRAPRASGGAEFAAPGWMMEYADRYSRAHNLSPAHDQGDHPRESNGNRFAISRKGAIGMMQLMPFTRNG
jgi:hypothetical protein